MLKRIFNSKTKNFTFSAFLVAVSAFLSGILGLLRDRLLAGRFGAGETLDVYFSAFRIPDLVQGIFVIGGIGAVFLPIFSEEFEKGKERAFRFVNNFLNFFLVFLSFFCFVLIIFAPQILKFVTPGFDPLQREKTAFLTRIMLLSPILFGLSSIFSGILQYFNQFLVYSLAPILYNLGIIFGILFFVPIFGISGLAFGVVSGAILYLIIQIPAAKISGYSYSRTFDFRELNLKKIAQLMIFPAIGLGFSQLNLILITALASRLVPGSISIFNFSKNLQSFPIGLIGFPFSVSIFPLLSKNWALKKKEEFWENFSLALREVLFLVVPLSVLILVLRAQIVRIVLGTGLFGWMETKLTAASLGIFSLSIFAFSLFPLFQKGFYSIQEMKTPNLLEIFFVFLNISLSIFFLLNLKSQNFFERALRSFLKIQDIKNIQVIAFPLALTISGMALISLLSFLFFKKTKFQKLDEISHSLGKILISSIFMGIGVWFILKPLAKIFPLITFWGIFSQTIFASLFGILIYLSGTFILKSPELNSLKAVILRKKYNEFIE